MGPTLVIGVGTAALVTDRSRRKQYTAIAFTSEDQTAVEV